MSLSSNSRSPSRATFKCSLKSKRRAQALADADDRPLLRWFLHNIRPLLDGAGDRAVLVPSTKDTVIALVAPADLAERIDIEAAKAGLSRTDMLIFLLEEILAAKK